MCTIGPVAYSNLKAQAISIHSICRIRRLETKDKLRRQSLSTCLPIPLIVSEDLLFVV